MQYDPKQGIDPATVAALNAAEDRKDSLQAFIDRRKPVERIEREPRQGELLQGPQGRVITRAKSAWDVKEKEIRLDEAHCEAWWKSAPNVDLGLYAHEGPRQVDIRPSARLLTQPIQKRGPKNTMGGM